MERQPHRWGACLVAGPSSVHTSRWRTYLQASRVEAGHEAGFSRTVRVVR